MYTNFVEKHFIVVKECVHDSYHQYLVLHNDIAWVVASISSQLPFLLLHVWCCSDSVRSDLMLFDVNALLRCVLVFSFMECDEEHC